MALTYLAQFEPKALVFHPDMNIEIQSNPGMSVNDMQVLQVQIASVCALNGRVFLPIQYNFSHWILVVVRTTNSIVNYYESMHYGIRGQEDRAEGREDEVAAPRWTIPRGTLTS